MKMRKAGLIGKTTAKHSLKGNRVSNNEQLHLLGRPLIAKNVGEVPI
jgi:hypothetical protein